MNRKIAVLVITACTLAFEIPVYAGLIATQHTTGHIRIINGTNAGISVTPTLLDFGNVTWGTAVTKQITVLNTGDCVEHVNATASQGSATLVNLYIAQIFPQHSLLVNATYNTQTLSPGDYTFGLDWTAACN
jgi:hypothetical protein